MNNLGQLFTTSDGTELTGLVSGDYFLDFMQGTITQPSGITVNMNKSLNDIGMSQCNSDCCYQRKNKAEFNYL